MTGNETALHLLCGKIGSGKSTLAAQLAQAPGTILVAQDFWMATLYPDELKNIDDYQRLVPRLRAAMRPHLIALLRAGLSLVLDFPANTIAGRAWLRGIADEAGVGHVLHILQASDELCLARLEKRNALGQHEYQVSRAEFDAFTAHFQPPTPDEGLTIVEHRQR